jgi:NAD(P)-dependent dehydrogenase (short-subunit alcohol dehydrogenase family)
MSTGGGFLNNRRELAGRTAIVTGASTGIGREIAKAIAAHGGRVGVVGRSTNKLRETQKQIQDLGGEAKVFQVDLRNEQDIRRLASEVLKEYGVIDIIANVAGVWHDKEKVYYGPRLWDTPEEQITEVLDVGIRAPMLLTRALLPAMVKQGRGKIIQISGTFESGASGWLHYYVSKKAIEQFTFGLAEELRPHKIQVNAISPSDTYTEAYRRFFPDAKQEQCLDPVDIANLAIFLLSEEADNITGACIVIRNKNAL